jgi:hypothetical protein
MKKPIKRTLLLGFALALFLSVALSTVPAQAQTDKRNQQNPQPQIVDKSAKPEIVDKSAKPEIVDKSAKPKLGVEVRAQQNLLDSSDQRRTAIPFQRFEMVHPATRKPLNPNAELRLPAVEPGGRVRVTTVKQFYDELNALEQELNKHGRSLRQPNTFADLKPKFNMQTYQQALVQNLNASNLGSNTPFATTFDVDTTLYVSDKTADEGTPEFPAKWVQQSFPNKGRKKFVFLLEAYKASSQLIKKVEWQVSANPSFTQKKWSGVATTSSWGLSHLGLDLLKTKGNAYASFVIDFGAIPDINPEPQGEPKNYFVRVIPYDAEGKPFKPSTIAIARYGAKEEFLEIHYQATDTAEGFNLNLPPDSISPFGVYVRGQGFAMTKAVKTTPSGIVPLGFKAGASAQVGMRVFNFLSIVDSSAPKNFEQDVLNLDFAVATGEEIGPETNRLHLDIQFLGESVPNMPVNQNLPNGSVAIPLSYNPNKKIDYPILNMWFSIGPVPIHINAELKGEVGVHLNGTVDPKALQITGTINPYIHTSFTGRGGVDAVIAYAKLEASIDPLFNADFTAKFDSKGSKLVTMSKNLDYLKGRVSLVAGFYYPCPSLKKIVGFITGDEDLPLCEQKWQYDIFEFPPKN